jgi:poly-gamma-glutamate capsule biosynthesis protein CapA/YwtB (metallophosphatase superfamily)
MILHIRKTGRLCNMKRFKIAAVILCLLLAGCGGMNGNTTPPPPEPPEPATTAPAAPSPTPTVEPTPTLTPEPTPTPEPPEVSIMAVGDLLFHNPIIASADKMAKDGYDFTYCFQHVKEILSRADLALGNFESTIVENPKELTERNSKSFGSPVAVADALAWAGFDILATANNHCNDRGRDNVILTVRKLAEKGLVPIGTRASADEKWHYIADVKGMKIGFTAYTYDNRRNTDLVNSFSTSKVAASLEKMAEHVAQLRSEGAEAVVVFIHWGYEYQRKPAAIQKKIAQGLADAGVDVIFGSHPHVMQEVDVLTGKSGNKTLVAYSLGNFISNQRVGYNSSFVYTEDCMILEAKLARQPDGKVAFAGASYLPTWTFMWTKSGQRYYTVVPLEKAIASPEAYGMNPNPKGSDIKKAETSLKHTQDLLADAVSKGILTPMVLD